MKYKKGFSILELTLVLGVGSLITFMKFQDMKNEQETVMANAVGAQIKQLGEAVNRYISVRYDKLSTLSNATGTGTDPGPRTCNSDSCEISYKTLINEGLLPVSYTGENLQKSSYKILLKRDGSSPNYVINGLVVTSTVWKDGTKIRHDLLGKAMMSAGIDSGVTRSATAASGYGGQWNEKSSDYNNITAEGLLAYRVGYDSSMYSVFLRRDGTLPMTGDLNMDGHNIKNLNNLTATGDLITTGNISGKDISASGAITSGGNVTSGHWIVAKNGNGNYMKFGGDNNGDFDVVFDSTVPTKLVGFFPSDKSTEFLFNFRGNVGVLTPDGTKTGVRLNGTTGIITASGNIESSQNIKGATLESTGRATVGEFIQLNGKATVGATCSPYGLQGRTPEGAILSCVSGVWKSLKGRIESTSWMISGDHVNYGNLCESTLASSGLSAQGWVVTGSDVCTEDEEFCTVDNLKCYAIRIID